MKSKENSPTLLYEKLCHFLCFNPTQQSLGYLPRTCPESGQDHGVSPLTDVECKKKDELDI